VCSFKLHGMQLEHDSYRMSVMLMLPTHLSTHRAAAEVIVLIVLVPAPMQCMRHQAVMWPAHRGVRQLGAQVIDLLWRSSLDASHGGVLCISWISRRAC
jgi:hypothetical protein